jgi:hypothetical protein
MLLPPGRLQPEDAALRPHLLEMADEVIRYHRGVGW